MIKPTVHFKHNLPTDPSRKRDFRRIGMPSANTGPKTNGKKVTITPTLENCDEMITLDCLKALYNINAGPPQSTDKNSFAIGMWDAPTETGIKKC